MSHCGLLQSRRERFRMMAASLQRTGHEARSRSSFAIRAAHVESTGIISLMSPADRELSATAFDALAQFTDDAIYTTDLDSIVTSWSAGAEQLYGFAAVEDRKGTRLNSSHVE